MFTTVGELARAPGEILASLGNVERVFVRPDSSSKLFSGSIASGFRDNTNAQVAIDAQGNAIAVWQRTSIDEFDIQTRRNITITM